MTKLRVKKNGSEDPPLLTYQQRGDWNKYVDFLEKAGYKGSPLLDKKETGLARGLFDRFLKEHPTSTINYDHIKNVQVEMQQLQKSAQAFAARAGGKDPTSVMSGTSKVDGWPGSKTTSFKFPNLILQQTNNDQLISKQNLGVVNPDIRTAATPKKSLPQGAKLERLADGVYYTDPQTGDLIKYQ